MTDGELPIRLKTRPVPQMEKLNDGSSLMKWRLEMSQPTTKANIVQVAEKLSNENFAVLPEQVGPKEILSSIVAKPGISYTDLWDFSSRSLLIVEELLGEIVSIEGTPRDDWRLQFVVAEHVGAFDPDKTTIMVAAESGDIGQLKAILSANPDININEATPFGLNALGYAAEKDHTEIVELLINAGATPSTGGEVTTIQAAVLGGVNIIRLLVEAGADVDATDRYGRTALMAASALGRVDIVKELLKNGADPKLEDNKGYTALRLAQKNQRTQIVSLLDLS